MKKCIFRIKKRHKWRNLNVLCWTWLSINKNNSFFFIANSANGKSEENEELSFEIQRQNLSLMNLPRSSNKISRKYFFVPYKNRENCLTYPIGVRLLKVQTYFLQTLFGALSMISLMPLVTKLHLLRTFEGRKISMSLTVQIGPILRRFVCY